MITMKFVHVLLLCASVAEGWNSGTSPSFHRIKTSHGQKVESRIARHYRLKDDENFEKLIDKEKGFLSRFRLRKVGRQEILNGTDSRYNMTSYGKVKRARRLLRRQSVARKRQLKKRMRRQKIYGKSNNTVGISEGDFKRIKRNNKSSLPSKIPFRTVVKDVHELRASVLDKGMALGDIKFDTTLIKTSPSGKGNIAPMRKDRNKEEEIPFDHEVLKLIKTRAQTNSKPGSRAEGDNAKLAISIEGGGMRGAVSAGMASAIACLGLIDTFDSIYGSSAGSVVGAYMVSRQMCVDVYTEVLTAAKTKFVSKGRLLSYLARGMVDQAINETVFTKGTLPAMNISYVLDSIMDPESGIRPLDMEHFRMNDKIQPLRIVASNVRNGKMEVSCLGSKEMDFFQEGADYKNSTIHSDVTKHINGDREGLFACLQTSMTVPAACGPPVRLLRHEDATANITSSCFDAFCFEPIPYRSAVEEGATHVLALRTRPHGIPIQTKPGFFEKIAAPNYFDSHQMPKVSNFFKKGGQQYIYAEDYLTLEEGLHAAEDPISIPPPKLLYGVELNEEELHMKDRSNWKKAHLLPIVVPEGNTEHPTLSVDRDEVLHAVRQGFATAFDILAPISGLKLEDHLNGERVAKLIFTSGLPSARDVLEEQIFYSGHTISNDFDCLRDSQRKSKVQSHGKDTNGRRSLSQYEKDEEAGKTKSIMLKQEPASIIGKSYKEKDSSDAVELLLSLPGFREGKLECLRLGLTEQIKNL